ncbi:DUF4397 domain-containing protein [Paenibacillus abyssi]|uniref:DUF4397 domain-containing protein n=1 Tax=Paenibacillus abyssi TaxID=1340531 RepID=A0A917FT45_9BACL|nr:DUF4397 domain-containing protein [Paenibacillus abyssi]GGF99362.1 hypothetical protein GCM10010916_15820 [Paenibacillus abyssi]
MNANEWTIQYWKKANLYGMLSDYFRYINPDKSNYYMKLHCDWLMRLANHIERSGDPFDYPMSSVGGGLPYEATSSSVPYSSGFGMPPGIGHGPLRDPFPCQAAASPYVSYGSQPIRMEISGSRVRIIHASPDAADVDVYINGKQAAHHLAYKDIVPYSNVTAGQYTIDLYPAGQKDRPILSQTLNVQSGHSYTVAACNKQKDLRLYAYIDDPAPAAGMAKLKFIHLSPDAPPVDIKVKQGAVLFKQVGIPQATEYASLPAGAATIQLFAAGTGEPDLEVPELSLTPDSVRTVIVFGCLNGRPPLETLLLSDL